MRIAGLQASCGFNIYQEEFDLQLIPDLIDACGLERGLRLGLASPIVGTENSFLDARVLTAIGVWLVDQLRKLERRNVLALFDCGFPLCMFSEEDLGSLALNFRGFHSVCPYPIDVGPDLTAWPCFPLSKCENVRLLDFRNAAELQAHYAKRLAGFRRMGTTDECLTCKYLERNQCCGGCVARTLKAWTANGEPDVMKKLVWATSPGRANNGFGVFDQIPPPPSMPTWSMMLRPGLTIILCDYYFSMGLEDSGDDAVLRATVGATVLAATLWFGWA